MGQVCARHQEFYETACRWCETPAVGLNAVLPRANPFGIRNPPSIFAPPTVTSPAFDLLTSIRRARMRGLQFRWTGHDPYACRICRLAVEDGQARTGHVEDIEPKDKHGGCE